MRIASVHFSPLNSNTSSVVIALYSFVIFIPMGYMSDPQFLMYLNLGEEGVYQIRNLQKYDTPSYL
jgi:hypothetical protein